ncbi:MAG TPA: PAS domain S-box protein, partial [Chloroflexota bacterium]|nr:PAS domain S-box protein [Chloroflexota bacterium]
MTVFDTPPIRLGPLRLLIGFLGIAIGVLMVVDPAQFAASLYAPLQPELSLWGWLAFLVGLSMVGVLLYAPPTVLAVLVHLAAGTLLVLFDLSLVHSGADFANAHYVPLAAAVFAAPWLDRRPLLRYVGQDLLGVTIAVTGLAAGFWLLALPGRFVSSSYTLVHPWQIPIGLAFAVGGVAMLASLLLGWRRFTLVEWGARILLGTGFWSFVVLSAWPNHFWTGVIYYGTMGILTLLGPFVVHFEERLDPASIEPRLAFALFAVALVSTLVALTLDLSVDQLGQANVIYSVVSARDVLVGVFLLFAGLASFLGFLLARAIARPLVSLADAVERPDWDRSSRLTLPRPDHPSEVRSLADALAATFETMARQKADLTSERDRLARILRQMPIGVVICEAPTGRLIFGNDQVAAIWRHPLIYGDDFERYVALKGFHPDGCPYRPEDWPIVQSLRMGKTVVGEQIAIERGDGTRGVLEITAGPIHDADGRIVAAVAAIEDVTERKLTADRLSRLQTITTRLASATTEAELGATIVSAAQETVAADSVIIYRVASEGDVAEMIFPPCDREDVDRLLGRIPLNSELPVAQAVRLGQVVTIPTPESIAHVPELYALFQSTGYYSAEVIPFFSEGHT